MGDIRKHAFSVDIIAHFLTFNNQGVALFGTEIGINLTDFFS